MADVATVMFWLILWGSSPAGFRKFHPLELQKVRSASGALRGPGMGWNLQELSEVPEDSASGFRVRKGTRYRVLSNSKINNFILSSFINYTVQVAVSVVSYLLNTAYRTE